MAELDHLERVLASYRNARRAPPELRDAVHGRLARDLAAQRRDAPSVGRRRARAIVIAASAFALAAAMILLWQSFTRPQAIARVQGHEQAGDQLPRPGTAAPVIAPATAPAELPPTSATTSATTREPPQVLAPTSARTRDRAAAARGVPTLAAELAGLEAIRAALAAGRTDEARAALVAHREAFPAGQLAREREALAIEALCQHGDEAAAQVRARGFARSYPGSTALAKLPAACR